MHGAPHLLEHDAELDHPESRDRARRGRRGPSTPPASYRRDRRTSPARTRSARGRSGSGARFSRSCSCSSVNSKSTRHPEHSLGDDVLVDLRRAAGDRHAAHAHAAHAVREVPTVRARRRRSPPRPGGSARRPTRAWPRCPPAPTPARAVGPRSPDRRAASGTRPRDTRAPSRWRITGSSAACRSCGPPR